ncbi:MAG TPA: lytic transglycosylase domain-containing protein [Thermoanaerobaculia bacterium]|nr:lytic transglycosylase domain-containing protein [Thermoanaerobaculia bacterium]
MRFTCVVLSVFVAASAFASDVRLAIKRDGKKVIYNVGNSSRNGGGSNLDWLAKRHDRRSKYDPIIERYSAKYGVDATLVRAVIQVESDFNPLCVSNKGARGLMQLMPETARRFGVTKIHDPEQNIHGGVRYLAYLTRLFNDDLRRALAAYNAGENAVMKYGGIPPYDETSEYVVRAMTVYHGRPYGSGGAVAFAGRKSGAKLKGGFGAGMVPPVAVALLPGVKFLGQH